MAILQLNGALKFRRFNESCIVLQSGANGGNEKEVEKTSNIFIALDVAVLYCCLRNVPSRRGMKYKWAKIQKGPTTQLANEKGEKRIPFKHDHFKY